MRHLFGFASVWAFLVLAVASGHFVSESNDPRGLFWAVILMFLAQGMLWTGGEFSPLHPGKLGLWRGIAMTVFIAQALAIPVTVFLIILRVTGKIAADEVGISSQYQLIFGLLGGLSAVLLGIISKVRWWRKLKLNALGSGQ